VVLLCHAAPGSASFDPDPDTTVAAGLYWWVQESAHRRTQGLGEVAPVDSVAASG